MSVEIPSNDDGCASAERFIESYIVTDQLINYTNGHGIGIAFHTFRKLSRANHNEMAPEMKRFLLHLIALTLASYHVCWTQDNNSIVDLGYADGNSYLIDTVVVRWEDGDSMRHTYSYDSDNRINYEVVQLSERKLLWKNYSRKQYSYRSDGLVTVIEANWVNGIWLDHTRTSFISDTEDNYDFKLVEMTHNTVPWYPVYRITTRFDDNGLLVCRNVENYLERDRIELTQYRYAYANGLLSVLNVERSVQGEFRYREQTTYDYDSTLKIVTATTGSARIVTHFNEPKKALLILRQYQANEEWLTCERTTNSYRNDGQLRSFVNERINGEESEAWYTISRSFDFVGRLFEDSTWYRDGNKLFLSNYSYDPSGNLVTCKATLYIDGVQVAGTLNFQKRDAFGNRYEWRGTDVNIHYKEGVTSAPENVIGQPHEITLTQNYPNPFNPTTEVGYELPEQTKVSLKVFDLLGREVATIVEEEQKAGVYKYNFNASRLSSGVYIYKLTAGKFSAAKRMVVLK